MAAKGHVVMYLHGDEALKRQLRRQQQRFFEEMARALPEEAQALIGQANPAAPASSGALAASSSVTVVEQQRRGRVRAAAAYLDEKAAAVHEGVHWGRFHPGTRGFKWLERVFGGFGAGALQRIALRLSRLVGGGS